MKPAYTFRLVSGEGGIRVVDRERDFFLFQDRGGFTSPEVALQAVEEFAKEKGLLVSVVRTKDGHVDRIEARRPVILNLSITPELDELLSRLALDLGLSKAAAVVKGIALLKVAADAKQRGKGFHNHRNRNVR